jgi:hypothetical protein
LRDLERPVGFAADAYVCRNLARIDLVAESAAFLPMAARSGQADAFAARPLLKDQRTKLRLGPRSENDLGCVKTRNSR